MNIYLISQDTNNNYDTYDSAVVVAPSEEIARRICPGGFYEVGENDHWLFVYSNGTKKDEGECPKFFSWCAVKYVKVKLLGKAKEGTKQGIICSSFNAG